MQNATRFQAVGKRIDDRLSDQSAFVMAFLWPGVREQYQYTLDGSGFDHVFNNFYRIMSNNAEVVQRSFSNALQQMTYAGCVDFNTDTVDPGLICGNFKQCVAVAKPDFDPQRSLPGERSDNMRWIFLKVDAVNRHQRFECCFLRRGYPAITNNKAAHRP